MITCRETQRAPAIAGAPSGHRADPFVSVVVATYGREETLCQTLSHLFDLDYPSYEIIVVDQTPTHTPVTERFLAEHRDRFQYVRSEPPSLPRARNVGVTRATGEIVVFLDDDVIPAPSLLRAHVEAYDEPTVGGVAGQVLVPGEPRLATDRVGQVVDRRYRHYNFNSTVVTDALFAQGCNMSFRRALIDEAGGFEPAFASNSTFEEIDLCLRLHRLGYRLRFEPQASVLHLVEASGGCGNRRGGLKWYYWFLHNLFLLALRHQPLLSLARIAWDEARTIVRVLRDPWLLPLWLVALPHAAVSFRRARAKRLSRSGVVT